MRSTITLNGKNSSEIEGLLIQSLPPISKPLMRTQIEEIDGRDGDIVTNLGFSAYSKQITIGLYGNFDINEVIEYFTSKGTVIFSNEPDKYYYYQIIDQIDFERLIRFRTATVSMHCQPFKYSATEGADILNASDNFATLDQSINTDAQYFTYTSNVQDDVTATRNNVATGSKFFATFTMSVVQGITYYFSGSAATGVTMYGYKDRIWGTSAGFSGRKLTSYSKYTATYTGTLIIGFYGSGTDLYIRNFYASDESGKVISGEGSLITLNGTTLAPFTKFDLKGDTEQQTYTGKNLLSATLASSPQQGMTITQDADGTIHLTGTATATYANFMNIDLLPYTLSATDTFIASVGEVIATPAIGATTIRLQISVPYQRKDYLINYGHNSSSAMQVGFAADRVAAFVQGLTSGTTYDITIKNLMIEKGSTATSFEPYVGGTASPNPDYPQEVQTVTGRQVVTISDGGSQSQEYEINFGKNLLNTSVGYENKYINSSGEEVADPTQKNALFNGYIAVQPNTSYTMTNSVSGGIRMNFAFYNGIALISRSTQNSGVNTRTITTPEGCNALRVWVYKDTAWTQTDIDDANLQIEKGSVATTYAPYFTPIELCKIGDYQDYIYKSGEDWYVHKAIEKVVLNGTENWTQTASGVPYTDSITNYSRTAFTPYSDNFYGVSSKGQATDLPQNSFAFGVSSTYNRMWVSYLGKWTTGSAVATWLTTNPTSVYYVLQNSSQTDTQITNATLITQLEALYTTAHAYKGTTYLTSTAADLPHIMSVAVAGSIDGTITNAGNTTARPKLTLFGSGNIGIYLNGNQIFDVALGTEGHITIDTNAMEAYQDTTDNLKNRLVTGDYSNFLLQAGDNQLSFSGNATMCVVENYSRWI